MKRKDVEGWIENITIAIYFSLACFCWCDLWSTGSFCSNYNIFTVCLKKPDR